jgi:hypothetical protein
MSILRSGFLTKNLDAIKSWSIRTRLIVGAVLIAGISLTGAAVFSPQSQAPKESAESSTLVAACSIPQKEYPESAFSIGLPEGWVSLVDNGTIQIMEDETNTTAAFIYAARLDQDLPAREFLADFAEVFTKIIESNGGSFAIGEISEAEGTAVAPATATVEEGELAGKFAVEKENGFVVLKVYWAPVALVAEKEPLLQEVTGCFNRITVLGEQHLDSAAAGRRASNQVTTSLTTHNGRYFRIGLPTGWKVTGETDSGIDTSNADASAGYSYFYVTGTSSAIEPEAWARQQLSSIGVSGLTLSNTKNLPAEIDGQKIQEFDYAGTFKGKAVRGKTTVGVYNTPDFGFGSYGSAFMGVQMAHSSLWDQVKSLTAQIQNSLVTTDIGSRANISLPPNRPIESVGGDSIISSGEYKSSLEDKSSKGWREAISGYEEVQSPSTGANYDVSLNSWNSTGPDGPGYYRTLPGGSLEKLEPTTP